MKETRSLMGMHITVEIVDPQVTMADIEVIYEYFNYIDETFSTYKKTSEISKINAGEIVPAQYSEDMKTVLQLCEQTEAKTDGYFSIHHDGKLNPTGLVKGWAIYEAAKLLQQRGLKHFYIDAGGDIQVAGKNAEGKKWTVGIRNPFKHEEIVKVLAIDDRGVATSGTAERGQHIYDPHHPGKTLTEIVSVTVIGPNVYEADRFATPAFAMGERGIYFLEKLPGFEGYMIDKNGLATYTTGFAAYCQN